MLNKRAVEEFQRFSMEIVDKYVIIMMITTFMSIICFL